MMSEIKKYAVRFGVVFGIAVLVILITQGTNAVQIIGFKIGMASIAMGLAELFWLVYFKPVFGKTEDLPSDIQRNILMFRSIIYAAIMVSFCFGM